MALTDSQKSSIESKKRDIERKKSDIENIKKQKNILKSLMKKIQQRLDLLKFSVLYLCNSWISQENKLEIKCAPIKII